MNLNKTWKSVIGTTVAVYLLSFILGVAIHALTTGTSTDGKVILPESYIQQISALKTITVEDSYKDYTEENTVFIDARDNAEYNEGHIKGAINIPYDRFQQYYPQYEKLFTKNKKIITYCHGIGCGLSVDVAKDLIALGYTNVFVMTEGWPGWMNANLPISVGKEP